MRYAEVVVDVPLSLGEEVFDYSIPTHLDTQVEIGSRVLVPFGKRKLEGYVIQIKNETTITRVRDLIEVLDDVPPLNQELIEVGRFISQKYLSPLFHALQAMVPVSLRSRYIKMIAWNQERDEMPLIVLPEEEAVLRYIKKKRLIEQREMKKKFAQADEIIERFIEKGFLREVTKVKDEARPKTEKVVFLRKSPQEIESFILELPIQAQKQKAILQHLLDHPVITLSELLATSGASRKSVQALQSKEIVDIRDEEVRRDPYSGRFQQKQSPLPLTREQQLIYNQIVQSLELGGGKTFLLHGVTGSGKTEVYLQIIQYVLAQGKEAIVLVPEISLTPMMVERFKRRFGDQVAVLHSGLSAGEKLDEWRRIRLGKAPVIVGARSAIFAPVKHLGVVIIDEEHETTYKQEETPRYHAREVAIKRASLHGAIVILGSATPSVESYAYGKAGRYELLEMKHRVNDRGLPFVHLVDMREEMQAGHRHMFSRLLLEKIEDRLRKKEQIVLLLNRRGYSTFVICRSCGFVAECPHCDITLTYHQTNQTIRCHYCGHTESVPKQCPKCASEHIRFFGTGTQKVEEELVKQFPGLRVIRMDMDTTARKGAHEQLLTAFGNHEADVLLGTQMIAKGLDFPKVSLVGMITADTMLHLPDFRSAERTFQLITQVAGRAGRHDIPGEVIVQTYTPEHYSIQYGVKQDYTSLFNQEVRMRKSGNYPPFYRLCNIHFSHGQVPVLVKAMERVAQELRVLLTRESEVLGPVPSQIPRIKDRYRYHCMIKYRDEANLNSKIKRALHSVEDIVKKHQIQVSVDIDPQVLM